MKKFLLVVVLCVYSTTSFPISLLAAENATQEGEINTLIEESSPKKDEQIHLPETKDEEEKLNNENLVEVEDETIADEGNMEESNVEVSKETPVEKGTADSSGKVTTEAAEEKETDGSINTEEKADESQDKEKNEQVDQKQEQTLEDESVEANNEEESVAEENQPVLKTFSLQMAEQSVESSTSKLGHLKSENVQIYKVLGDSTTAFKAGSTYTNAVYYIKKQAKLGNDTYYLIRKNPTYNDVGWVRAEDMSTASHVGVDKQVKTYYVRGTGNAYTKAWGGKKDLVFTLSNFKDQIFKVHLTEKVGKDEWYRGTLAGKTVWIHPNYLSTSKLTINESSTSKLGHLKSGNVQIYKELGDNSTAFKAGSTYTNCVYYIKKQAKLGNETYYLIRKNPTYNDVGWVKAKDMSTASHVGVNKQAKLFYVKGTSNAYTKAWGGKKDIVYNLSNYKNQVFKVHLTEKVGDDNWYRGTLGGKTVWIHPSNLTTLSESSISKLGHLKSANVKIFKELGDPSTVFQAGATYTNAVYYIKRQAVIGTETYYLIRKNPTYNDVGWVKANDLSTADHVGVNKQVKLFYVNGAGNAYTKAWGGAKDIVFDLSKHSENLFKVHLTEKVGKGHWYRGTLEGRTVWIHPSNLTEKKTKYTDYNFTLNQAVDQQMGRSPQTDQYRNNSAFIHADYVDIVKAGAITENGVRLRTSPDFSNNISATVNSGTKVEIIKEVKGATYDGSTRWYEIKYNNKTLYVHSSLAKQNALSGTTKSAVNVRENASATSHIYGTLAKGSGVNIIRKVSNQPWYEITYNTWRNAKRNDVEYYVNPNNNNPFQHLLLTSSVGVSAAELNKVLAGKGILAGQGQAFINGGKLHSINEVYLISHALLETGQGTSKLAKGVEVGKDSKGNLVLVTSNNRSSLKNIKKVHNMFGIQAYDSCALECGAKHAYSQGWDTPAKAIEGGAKFIGKDYIHNQYNQNTLYKMRWNFQYLPKQYATDIGWAVKQTSQIERLYNQLSNPMIHYDIVRFR